MSRTGAAGLRRGFTLIEILVVLAILALLIALLLPAVQAAREAARRARCLNNLRQLALAAMNYEGTHGAFRPGSLSAPFETQPGVTWGLGTLVRLLPYFEAGPTYDAANFSLQAITWASGTVAANAPSTLWCPSDPLVSGSDVVDPDYGAPAGTGIAQRHASYGGCQGTWSIEILAGNPPFGAQLANMNGLISSHSATRIADIADGTGTTVLLAETAYGRVPDATHRRSSRWWNSGFVADSMVSSYDPLNGPSRGVPYTSDTYERWVMAAGSFHPGGANVAFADGSARFLTDTLDSVAFDPATGAVPAFRLDPARGTHSIAPGARLGIWQELTTRNFGEVVPADSY